MKTDNLHFDAQDKLYTGIRKVAQAVGATMGTAGSNAVLEAIENPGHLMTNDGSTIANSIVLADPIEDMGRKILLESINRANKQSGDGSSTTCVLTAAIIEEGRKHLNDAHPMDIKRSLEACLPVIEEALKAQSREVAVDNVHQVATISAEDEEIGRTIGDIYKQIGPKGIVYWDVSKTSEDSYTLGQGITVEGAGYFSPYMCDVNDNGQASNQIRIKDAQVLITRQKISSAADFEQIGSQLYGDNVRDLVVFCDEVDPLVLPDIITTRIKRGFRFALVKMPVLWRDWWYEDLALATGATVIDPGAGLTLKQVTKEHLGTVDNILVTKEDTFLDGIKDVSEHVAKLEATGEDDDKLRASRLNTKTARYFVGAHSESALAYRRLKVEDAISAAYQALNGGVVVGGGMALYNASRQLGDGVGGKILEKALQAPIRQIITNSGSTTEQLEGEGTVLGGDIGWNSKTRKVENLIDAGVIDPTNVQINAVRNAISVAATVLTAPTLVTLPREDAPQLSPAGAIMR